MAAEASSARKEITSIFLPSTKLVRCLLSIFIVSDFAIAASTVHATMTCSLFDEFPAVSDWLAGAARTEDTSSMRALEMNR
jgi:hypothetical protein